MVFETNVLQDLRQAIPKSHRKDEVVSQVDGGLRTYLIHVITRAVILGEVRLMKLLYDNTRNYSPSNLRDTFPLGALSASDELALQAIKLCNHLDLSYAAHRCSVILQM